MTDVQENETASDELKPCPFCGGNAETITGPVSGRWGVRCLECDVWRDDRKATEAEAIAAWNRRARTALPTTDGAQQVAVKALEWSNPTSGGYPIIAVSAVGRYAVWAGKDLWLGNEQLIIDGTEHHASLEAAKAAAQTDFEARIRSALTYPAPAPGPADAVSEAEVEAAMKAALTWQPMETAPKHGELVLLARGDERYAARWTQGEVNGPCWCTPDGYVIYRPTAWHSLPEVPSAALSGRGK